ncbi:hypothetical protein [Allorhizobium ampelinum]|uniref:hypothetical protein n=1 Tax=Allorhizobium ampelinum TaxID=3025782 RepID=UPI000B3F8B5A|nr:hypothetical protein [Allorhizobium ampelinum]NTA27436.1 hypothetical protein [Allorhizobium ampelinum]OVE94493.1 hypothetical protein B7W85_13150 [Allorhizobium ampelinum]
MITTQLTWSTDISKAPKGDYVTTNYTVLVKGQPQERTRTEHVPTKILALTNCGMVVSTYWRPAEYAKTVENHVLNGDCWSGFSRGTSPVMWTAWPDAKELALLSEVETA